jgi:hypothetical protein
MGRDGTGPMGRDGTSPGGGAGEGGVTPPLLQVLQVAPRVLKTPLVLHYKQETGEANPLLHN